jgi:hypothetical protein
MPTPTLNKVTAGMLLRVGFFPPVAANSSLEAPIFRLGARKSSLKRENAGSEREIPGSKREIPGSEQENPRSGEKILARSEKIGARSEKTDTRSGKTGARSAFGEVEDLAD